LSLMFGGWGAQASTTKLVQAFGFECM
jgi:hypothetical protein